MALSSILSILGVVGAIFMMGVIVAYIIFGLGYNRGHKRGKGYGKVKYHGFK